MAIPIVIPGQLLIPTAIPLDAKVYFKTLADLGDLGESNSHAYMYYKGMIVLCLENINQYIWFERPEGFEANGVLDDDFLYPDGVIIDDIVYGGKHYNFFKLYELFTFINPGTFMPGFRFRPGFYPLTDNDEQPLDGGWQPGQTFTVTENLPYRLKYKINVFYTEEETTIQSDVRIFDQDENLVFSALNDNMSLPAYPGEFQSQAFALPELEVGVEYRIDLSSHVFGSTDNLTVSIIFKLSA